MKKKKTMLAVAAVAAVGVMFSAMPKAWADPNAAYSTTLSSGIEANSTGKYKSKNSDGTYAQFTEAVPASQNTTVVKKILIIEDDATVPAATFNITASAGAAIPLESDDTTHLAVKAGMNPQSITWKTVASASNKAFDTDSGTAVTATATETTSTAPVTFTATSVISGVTDTNIENGVTLSTADTSLVISKGAEENYYAEKELQLDFSACAFTEPGVYRYILTEAQAATNVGIIDDTNLTRTVDVYVEDASYYLFNSTEGTYTLTPELRIAGYVMYVGTVTTAPLKASTTEGNVQVLEDGTRTSPSADHPVGAAATKGGDGDDANKAADKSVGFKNTYDTNKLKITKTVTGNQGSRDQYFKFTLKSNPANDSRIADTAVFYISKTESNLSTTLSGDTAPNSATNSTYTSTTISNANKRSEPATGMDTTKILGTFTGAQLKEGVDFYLQHDQYITVTGLPTGTVTEVGEDYKVKYEAKSGANLDNVTGDTWNTDTNAYNTGEPIVNGDGAVGTADGVSAVDTNMKGDAQVDFTNTKEGVIPTGVILSVAAPVIIGIIAAAGIIAIFIRKRRKAD